MGYTKTFKGVNGIISFELENDLSDEQKSCFEYLMKGLVAGSGIKPNIPGDIYNVYSHDTFEYQMSIEPNLIPKKSKSALILASKEAGFFNTLFEAKIYVDKQISNNEIIIFPWLIEPQLDKALKIFSSRNLYKNMFCVEKQKCKF